MPPFSVVMALYHRDDPVHFQESVDSILSQSLRPDELILVVDGPIGADLERILTQVGSQSMVRVVRLPTNAGPGHARHVGIEAAQHDIVALMDADDIAVPQRFALQLPVLSTGDADVVGGFIEEFDVALHDTGRIRTVPTTHEQIVRFGRWRQPVNHVTIMFRRDAYRRVGGYQPIRSVEDFDLLSRMLMDGVRFANVPAVLVHARCGAAMLRRRGGLTYLRREITLLRRMHEHGYLSLAQFIGNVAIRVTLRLLPVPLLALLYQRGLRRRRISPVHSGTESPELLP
jgi:glycosyltransferase involved in cell wall biosynthesis